MPIATFLLEDLHTLIDANPDQLVSQTFAYGLEATIQGDSLEVEVTAERPDLLSSEGFSRALKVYQGGQRLLPPSLESSRLVVQVDPSVIPLRPHIAALVVENLCFTPASLSALIQFQEKVTQTFGRQRQKSAIGLYNLPRIQGNLTYRAVEWDSLEFVALGDDRPRTPRDILSHHPKGIQYATTIAPGSLVPILQDEANQVLAMPPIVNAAIVGEITIETTALLIDVTGTSPKTVQELANILAHNFIDRRATVKTVEIHDQETGIGLHTPDLTPRSISFSAKFLNEMLGTYIPKPDLGRYLERMNLHAIGTNVVEVPSYRTDMGSEVDLAGDLMVAIGLENLQADYSDFKFYTGQGDRLKVFAHQVGDWAQRMGLLEVKSYVLTDPERLASFVTDPATLLTAQNARSRSHSTARPTLQAGLLEILSRHIQAPKPLNIYEIGDVILGSQNDRVEQAMYWGFACLDAHASFSLAKSYIQTLLRALHIPFQLADCSCPQYIPYRAAIVLAGDQVLGHFGEIHPQILEQFYFPEPVCTGELNCNHLLPIL